MNKKISEAVNRLVAAVKDSCGIGGHAATADPTVSININYYDINLYLYNFGTVNKLYQQDYETGSNTTVLNEPSIGN